MSMTAAATWPDDAVPARADALRFTAFLLFCCLVLQRFGVPFGGKAFNVVGPLGLAAGAYFLARGALAFDRFRLRCFLVLAFLSVIGLAWHAVVPGRQAQAPNLQSLAQFLLLTAFATLAFAEPVSESRFFRQVTWWFALMAVTGAIQFVLQFVGVRVFQFTGLLPGFMLFELGYNLVIPLGVGSLLKSNGFFIIEPSTFSQIMALGLIIEILAFRRPAYLALFIVGMLLSFSGTGWIVVASFIAAAAIGMGWRGIAIALGTVLLLGTLAGAGALLAPDIAGALQQRMDEVSRPGTSGHRRFVTPFWIMDDTLNETPAVAVIGLGAGVSERLTPTYDYDVNTPVKIALEFGFPALLAYVLLFVGAKKSPIQRSITVPVLVMYFVAGAYQQFPPVLFLVLLLLSVARLQPDAAAS